MGVPKERVEKLLPDESRARLSAMRAEMERMKKTAPPSYPVVHTLKDGQSPKAMTVLIRGNPETPGPEAPRRFLSILGGTPFATGSGRLELARAIASPDNPLTARVMVNRLWQLHFGRGLVGTPSNFGKLGERPTHPELLDHLAHRFVAEGWSLKAMHRAIMLSATYGQDSRHDEHAFEVDPENTLLWRMNRRRLEVEAWRDAMLAVSGRLDPTVGGPSRSLDDPGEPPPDVLRGRQPARPLPPAPPLRLPRPEHHQRRADPHDRPAPGARGPQRRPGRHRRHRAPGPPRQE